MTRASIDPMGQPAGVRVAGQRPNLGLSRFERDVENGGEAGPERTVTLRREIGLSAAERLVALVEEDRLGVAGHAV